MTDMQWFEGCLAIACIGTIAVWAALMISLWKEKRDNDQMKRNKPVEGKSD